MCLAVLARSHVEPGFVPRRIRAHADARRRRLALLAAPLVGATMAPAMGFAGRRLGPDRGYVAVFAVYWAGWCVAIPLALLGPRRLWSVATRPGRDPSPLGLGALAVGPVGGMARGAAAARRGAEPRLMASAAAVGALNGALEELLWRGLYVELFAGDARRGCVWPAVWFAAWHVAPFRLHAPERPIAFIAGAALLGLAWGAVAQRTGAIRWTIAAHALTDAADVASPIARRLAGGT
jgi:membrane protease YdiL (CAAX protease family)